MPGVAMPGVAMPGVAMAVAIDGSALRETLRSRGKESPPAMTIGRISGRRLDTASRGGESS